MSLHLCIVICVCLSTALTRNTFWHIRYLLYIIFPSQHGIQFYPSGSAAASPPCRARYGAVAQVCGCRAHRPVPVRSRRSVQQRQRATVRTEAGEGVRLVAKPLKIILFQLHTIEFSITCQYLDDFESLNVL